MPRTLKENIHDQDCRWMTWLKKTSQRKGTSGQTLLAEFADESKEKWYDSLHHMCSEQMPDWVFCRSFLSSDEMASCKERYLSRFAFVAGNHSSKLFVDALMAVDDAQYLMKSKPSGNIQCSRCKENETEKKRLLAALSARNMVTYDDIQFAAVVSVFQRYFILGDSYSTTKNKVRFTIENVMQTEISLDERLPAQSLVWKRFVSEYLGGEIHGVRSLPCRLRDTPLKQDECPPEQPKT